MSRVVTFGEVLLRLSPDVGTRILQANKLAVNYGGSEANVASSLALLGDSATLVSKVPNNMLGKAAVKNFRGLGVDTSQIKIGGQRLGIYFLKKVLVYVEPKLFMIGITAPLQLVMIVNLIGK